METRQRRTHILVKAMRHLRREHGAEQGQDRRAITKMA